MEIKKISIFLFGLIALPLLTSLEACGILPTSIATSESQPALASGNPVELATSIPSNVSPAFDLSLDLDPVPLAGNYQFSEGPATDADGNVYFSDINAGIIYKWSSDGNVTVFLDGLNMPNGMDFDASGNLIVCEGGSGRLISIDPQGKIKILVDKFNSVRFNEPNDLWIDPEGGIYFTDPAFHWPVIQEGEDVYYLSPDHRQVIRVINDMVKPNGVVGTTDGKKLYVADHGAGLTFVYAINSDGTVSNKRLFVSTGSDGMTLDASGNLYLTVPNRVEVFDASGTHLKDIPTLENPTNVTFAGSDGLTLFITARTAAYTIQLSTQTSSTAGINTADNSGVVTNTGRFILTSPDLPADGRLPIEYTCDGASSTLALAWSGAPTGTMGYAVIMHHVASPADIHWYWVVYNIPADVTSLQKNFAGIGMLGTNSVNDRAEYAPPCSKGPGDKIYTYTVYALSAQPQLSVSTSKVDRATLLAAIQNITLTSAELNVIYARP